MTDFKPPISERETEELIGIAHSSTKQWQQEAISQAKKELVRRNITEQQQREVLEKWEKEYQEWITKEKERLENNKTESYKIWEMILMFIFGPILIIRPYLLHSYTLFNLRGENYYLKFKQRIIIFSLSFISWFVFISYSTEQSNKKRLEEIDKIDISDWKEKHGYD
ncbi:hypothetical protein [Marinirhabdus gelatinilytica]|uniref:Uncharacterized protein n=1 Tax=Marinirhabdus gelatinilytica TaxID=1703343 RepID=A0A370QB46_9FLAO|nr:hypothetical protein [Marinirhabdus gelatinilytica]RDK85582.1 hypothetical protein C8D94_103409 [Marinirhabdus gelatinilytica]